jgi:hypothetical protein
MRYAVSTSSAALLFAALAASASVPAQVALRAVTPTGLFALSDSAPPNADITSGRVVADSYSGADGSASARCSFSVSRTDRQLQITLVEEGSATWNSSGGGFFFPSAWVGANFGSTPHRIDVELASQAPMRVRLVVTTCSQSPLQRGYYDGSLTITGHGKVANGNWPQANECSAPAVATFELTLGPTPTVLVFETRGHAQSSRINGTASFHARWALELDHLPPCPGTPYETPCGATMAAYGTLNEAGTWFEVVDSGQPAVALLLLGTLRQHLPIWGCVLYTDFPVILPLALNGPRAAIYVPPRPPAMVTMQGVTFSGGAGFHASNGLDVQCR